VIVRRPLLVLGLLVWAADAQAQTVTDERVWFNTTFQARGPAPDSPWRWAFEAYARSREGINELELAGIRPTVMYALGAHSSIGGGFAYVTSFPSGGGTLIEHRYFGHFGWTSAAAGGTLTLRTRVEARMLEGNSGAQGRVREQVRYSRPIRVGSRVSWVTYDELLVHLNNTSRNARGIDQNRLFGGVGFAATPALRIDAGYVNQYYPGHRGAPDRMNHVLSGTLVVSF
jgi:hypothetical protein